MMAKYIWETGSIIITVLGSIHLYYTFYTNKFSSRNEKLLQEMKTSFPILTKEMTMWNGWISFNATHSIGAIFIGVINFYLALNYFEILQYDHFFFVFNIFIIAFYLWLARKYWFKKILMGVLTVLVCFVISYILILLNN